MNVLHMACWQGKRIFCALLFIFFVSATSSYSADFVKINIYPEHVGVFTTVGKQQFVAYGIDQNFGRTNITKMVDWISSNEKLVTIDDTGMATILPGVTSGQVKITCSYPKTGGPAGGGSGAGILLLLNKE